MLVRNGDLAQMRDGRTVLVTDAADSDPDAWRTYSQSAYDRDGSLVVSSSMPPETIFVGTRVRNPRFVLSDKGQFSVEGDFGGTVTSDMSEVLFVHKP